MIGSVPYYEKGLGTKKFREMRRLGSKLGNINIKDFDEIDKLFVQAEREMKKEIVCLMELLHRTTTT